RIAAGVDFLDLAAIGKLDFSAPDHARFPCLTLARHALRAGGNAPAVLNAANEVAVAAFLASGRRVYLLSALIADTLAAVQGAALQSLDDVFAADRAARDAANLWLARRAPSAALSVQRALA